MTRINWNYLFGSDKDADDKGLLGCLHSIESTFVRMITGVVLFFWETVPDVWRKFLVWLRDTLSFAIRVAVRLTRVFAVSFAWLAIVLGPLAFYPGFVSVGWMAVALVGSIWGLRRARKKRVTAAPDIEVINIPSAVE